VSPDVYLDLDLDPEWLRYYIAAKLNAKVEDLDFNPDDFVARVNSDLIGKYVNIASRASSFITKHFAGELSARAPEGDSFKDREGSTAVAWASREMIAQAYQAREYGKVLREVMRIADRVNERFDQAKPWELAKDPAQRARLQDVCSDTLNAFRALTYYLAPVLPRTAERVGAMFDLALPLRWADIEQHATRIQPYRHLMTRIDPKQIDSLIEGPKAAQAGTAASDAQPEPGSAKVQGDKLANATAEAAGRAPAAPAARPLNPKIAEMIARTQAITKSEMAARNMVP
jgi:methionyl-tRNA synthetase